LKNVPWWVAAGVLAATTIANTAASEGDRLVSAVLAAVTVGAAIVVVHARKQMSPKASAIVVVACVAAAVTALVTYKYAEAVCIATGASGQRVVIGTELTESGLRYRRQNPNDNNSQILEALAGHAPDSAWTVQSIRRCRLILTLAGGLWIPLLGASAVAASAFFGSDSSERKPARTKARAFISYCHEDAAAVSKLRDVLCANDIDVIVDSEAMLPGERISDFIDRSIRNCDVVVSVVSDRSLASAWVASETVLSFSRLKWDADLSFVACCLDDAWLQPEFRLQLTQRIDDRLRRIESLLPDYAAQRIDSADLNEEKTRLYSLRNNLGHLLALLKEALCLDIREARFDASSERLVATIRDKRRALLSATQHQ
jgi:hypothetical protein